MDNSKLALGAFGTMVSATGAAISVTEVQAIISIIVTVLSFTISVLIPLGIKLYKKIKEAMKDGKITKEEAEEIEKRNSEILEHGNIEEWADIKLVLVLKDDLKSFARD